MRNTLISIVLCWSAVSLTAWAQQTSQLDEAGIYGNIEQPGYQLQQSIKSEVKSGKKLALACESVLQKALQEDAGILNPTAYDVVVGWPALSLSFINNIAQVALMPEGIKMTIEDNPGRAENVITLGIALYPDYAQEIVNAAILSGELSPEDALLAALSAGADPALVSVATAAGLADDVAAAPAPIGVGVGAGGSGGGDTTASTN